jgi:hypothetical protein
LLGAEGVDAGHQGAHPVCGHRCTRFDLGIEHGQEVVRRDVGGGPILPLRQQGCGELALVFGPAALVGLGVVLDVPLGERAERQHFAGGAFFVDRIAPSAVRLARQSARRPRHGWEAAEG